MEQKIKPVEKIVNHSFIREVCHNRGVKISHEAIKELSKQLYNLLLQVIEDTKEMEAKIILRRFVERRL